jgi:GxxExxY protein
MRRQASPPSNRYSEQNYPQQRLSGLVIAAGYEVHRAFGFGFLESVYRKAIVVELMHRGAAVQQEVPFKLLHRGVEVGAYRADIVVATRVIVEVKAGLLPDPSAPAQLLNYLAASGLEVGLVLHFGSTLEIKRVVRRHHRND